MKATTFIEKANKRHQSKFDYSLIKDHNSHDFIEIICPTHGIFKQRSYGHLNGYGCSSCSKNRKQTIKDFVSAATKIHNGKYSYANSIYKNAHTPLLITCKTHGDFKQKPNNHLNGQDCPRCGEEIRRKEKTLTQKEFEKRANEIHNNIYDYSKTIYLKSREKVKIICLKHGEFLQTAHSHMNGVGCPSCNVSKGEQKIEKFLIENKITFKREKKFDDCKDKYRLRFDFYLPQKNICIEFDGIQHYKRIGRMSISELETIQRRDQIKNKFCALNNIELIRIPYYDYQNIEVILSKNL